MLQTEKYYENYAYLKRLGTSYKLVKCNAVRRKGIEKVDVHKESDYIVRRDGLKYNRYVFSQLYADFSCKDAVNGKVLEKTNDEKLANNICRSRNKILEYVLCNNFVFFVTLTLDPEKYNRENLPAFIKGWRNFVKNYNKRKNADIKYLLIPETHEDGCWHMHGFIKGLPYDRLELFELHGERPLPEKIVNKLKKNELVFNFPEYEKRFGYNTFEPIKNKKHAALYMCKYLTKDISRNVTELGNHLYYVSQGLKKAEVIKQGQFMDSEFNFDFKNEYGGQSFYDTLTDEELDELMDKIGGAPVTIDDIRRGYRLDSGWRAYCDTDTGEIVGTGYSELMKNFDKSK